MNGSRVAEDAGARERPNPADRRQALHQAAAPLIELQRGAGNRAVTRLLRGVLQRQRIKTTYTQYIVNLDQAPTRANIQSYVNEVKLGAAIAEVMGDESVPKHTRNTVRKLKDELNERTKAADWRGASTQLGLLVDEINRIPVREPFRIDHRPAKGNDIVAAAADNMTGPCASMIAAFPVASVEGKEGAGSIVVIKGDKTVKTKAKGHVEIELESKYHGLRIDLQGSHEEDKGGGNVVRCVRFAVQFGTRTYASIIVESKKDFPAGYLGQALLESMQRRTQAHVYMD